jgi:uncharacterized protein (TIGR03118 family)
MKSPYPCRNSLLALTTAIATFAATAQPGLAEPYEQTNLVSDLPGLATLTDPELKNSWGVSETATSPFWISNQGTNTSTLYAVTNSTHVTKVNINSPSGFVGIPTTASGAQGPTGQVANTNTSSFDVVNGGNGGAAHFIFANLNGTISAWDTGASAFVQTTTVGAVYTGVAINAAQTMIYAANDAGTGSINVFNNHFSPVSLGAGAFIDPQLPSGLVPFNVSDIGGSVYVMYAPAGRSAQTGATAGMGVVDRYSESGVLEQRVITGGPLAAPWGIALAPSDFGRFSNTLLIGNFSFGDSEINAFNPSNGAFLGTIAIAAGAGNTAGGLWDLTFGNGGNGGSKDTLYFSDGINGERDGLFGALTAVPEPSTIALFAAPLAFLGLRARKRYTR